MGSLSAAVQLGDVRDVDAFVNATINANARLARLPASEREDLEAEGFLIVCELWQRYQPFERTRGTDRCSFAGYLSSRLPGRLVDAWHRLNRGQHVRRPNRDGHRVWEYRTLVSLDAAAERPTFSEARLRRLNQFEHPPARAAA